MDTPISSATQLVSDNEETISSEAMGKSIEYTIPAIPGATLVPVSPHTIPGAILHVSPHISHVRDPTTAG